MESPGARLKKIRLEKGISLEEAHKKTKIHLNILKALEEDSPISLNPVYIRGFLKIYCKFLGVDPADYITDYKEPSPKISPILKVEDKLAWTEKEISLKIFSLKIPIKIKSLIILISSILFVIFFFYLGISISLKKQKSSLVTSPLEVKPALTKLEPKSQIPSSLKPTPLKTIRLTIAVKENCWIKVRVDGRLLAQRNFKKGTSETWEAKDKIELALSNASAVDLIVNDQHFSNLGKRGQVIRSILITKEGLNIQP